jgi:hypothetical protein
VLCAELPRRTILVLFQERDRRQVSSQHLLPAWHKADRHELTLEWRVRFLDASEGHLGELEPSCDSAQGTLVGHGKHDGVRPGGQVSRTCLPSGVDQIRCENS